MSPSDKASERWRAIVSAEARGDLVSSDDAAFADDFARHHAELVAQEGATWQAVGELGDEPLPGEADDAAIVAGALAGLRAPTFLVDNASALVDDREPARGGVSRGSIVVLVATVALATAAAAVLMFGPPALRLGQEHDSDPRSLSPAVSEDPQDSRAASEREPEPSRTRRGAAVPSREHAIEEPPEPTIASTDAVEDLAPPVDEDEAEDSAHRITTPLPSTADGLLSHAQQLLRDGKQLAAMRAYRRLVDRYPNTREAKAALVSMGRIALGQGKAKQALEHFDAYLAASAGPLVEEARYGRIRALRKLGRTTQELHSIDAFLADHGDSIYAPRLRKRAEELRR